MVVVVVVVVVGWGVRRNKDYPYMTYWILAPFRFETWYIDVRRRAGNKLLPVILKLILQRMCL